MVPAGGARGRVAGASRDRARARLRLAARRLAVPRDGRVARAQRPRVDAHDHDAVVGDLGARRSGARGDGACARAAHHPRRSQALERDARSRGRGARSACVRPRPRSRVAARVASRLASRRRAGARARGARRCRHGRLGRARADPQAGDARRSCNGSLRARLHHVPRADWQGGLRRHRPGGPPRAQANAGARAGPARRRPASGRPLRPAAPREEAVASIRARRRRASRLGAVPPAPRAHARGDRRERAGAAARAVELAGHGPCGRGRRRWSRASPSARS